MLRPASSISPRSCTRGYASRVHAAAKAAVGVLLMALVAGCGASSEVSQRQVLSAQEQLPRPGRIIVYDILATVADVPPSASITGHYSLAETPQTPQEIEVGRRLGAMVADELARRIVEMGMPAERAGFGPPAQQGDVLITGQFITIDEGNRGKRVVIGFGKGGGELRTHIEGYLVTETEHRLLGSREIGTAGGKSPGLLVSGIITAATKNPVGLIANAVLTAKGEKGSESLEGAAKRTSDEMAKELRAVFEREGWI